MDEISIKQASNDTMGELKSIGFDLSYIQTACEKYKGHTYKIFNLKPHEANILKQICLSLGFDCAVNRDAVTCKCEKTDCLIFASENQLKKLAEKLTKQPFRLKEIAQKLNKIMNDKLQPLSIRNFVFTWERPYIMGILNVTPDSFSDGGKYDLIDSAYSHCVKMIDEGADIIDIGGESTRPEAIPVTVEDEISRIIPIVKKIRQNNISIPISIDTRNFETAKAAINEGADIINDVSGLNYDKKLFDFVTHNNIPTVIVHSDTVKDSDIIEEIYFSLNRKIQEMIAAGMDMKNIIADVGIGFGKNAGESFEILKRMKEFQTLKVPLLLGISRKSFMRNTFDIDFNEADTVTALYSSLLKNINIHRVHNVKLTKKFLDYSKLL